MCLTKCFPLGDVRWAKARFNGVQRFATPPEAASS
jgi:hypothetical protein